MEPTLNGTQIDHYRRRLLEQLFDLYRRAHSALREEQLGHILGLEGSGVLELEMSYAEPARALEAAVERIATGAFGICVDCGCAIERERLEAAPWTERCASDEEAQQRSAPVEAPLP